MQKKLFLFKIKGTKSVELFCFSSILSDLGEEEEEAAL